MLIHDLPKSASLPVSLVAHTKLKLQANEWSIDFQYIFFTESDQIIISCELPMLYQHLKNIPSKYYRLYF